MWRPAQHGTTHSCAAAASDRAPSPGAPGPAPVPGHPHLTQPTCGRVRATYGLPMSRRAGRERRAAPRAHAPLDRRKTAEFRQCPFQVLPPPPEWPPQHRGRGPHPRLCTPLARPRCTANLRRPPHRPLTAPRCPRPPFPSPRPGHAPHGGCRRARSALRSAGCTPLWPVNPPRGLGSAGTRCRVAG